MRIGLGTYAYYWRWSSGGAAASTLDEMLLDSARLGAEVFQICDYPPLDDFDDRRLSDIRSLADGLGITLEVGTRGIRPSHLRRYLDVATKLGACTVRSMLHTADHKPTVAESIALLAETAAEFAQAGVELALETYEQVATDDLIEVVNKVGEPHVGICLDPANCVARLEHPLSVIGAAAPHVKNLHVKDFTFARQQGWVGFTLIGCRLGDGMLPLGEMLHAIAPYATKASWIVEHWVPPGDTSEATRAVEQEWTRHSLTVLRGYRGH